MIATAPRAFSIETIDGLASDFERIFGRREKFVLIFDARPLATIPDARWRKQLADWINNEDFRARHARYNLGSANLLPFAAPIRAVMTAINWVWKPPTPQAYPGDMTSAIDWAIEQLEIAKIPVPQRVHSFRELSTRQASNR